MQVILANQYLREMDNGAYRQIYGTILYIFKIKIRINCYYQLPITLPSLWVCAIAAGFLKIYFHHKYQRKKFANNIKNILAT